MNPGGWGRAIAATLVLAGSGAEARAQPAQAGQIKALYQQGERALSEGRYGEAEQAYERLRQLQPGVAEVDARLGLIYFQQGRFTDAIAPLRRALTLKPALPNIGSLLAMSLSEIGRHEEALAGLQQAFRQQSSALRRMAGLHLQRAYTSLNRDREAVETALELSRLYPEDPEILYHSGRVFGNYAYLQTVKLARVAPDSVWLHQAAGEANESQGQLDEAISEYEQVLALAPNRPGLHFRLGRVLLTRARQANGDAASEAEALKHFEQELQIDPTNASAAYEIGERQRQSGQLDKAVASFRRAVDAYPGFGGALVGLGRTLVAMGDPGAALPHLQKAVSIDPRDEVALYQMAQAHRALGQEAEQQKALAAFQRVREEKAAAVVVPAGPPTVTRQILDSDRGPQ
ncbi:MAG: tetratricopeptide repeat protein [Acidobacteriota bacterium]|nr:tetratricopeptide repeat protein [Acidobacteriota bacterium]